MLKEKVWGKRDANGATHPLVDHCIDVAVVFRKLLESKNLARLPATLDEGQKDRLAVIAYLHDLGKCNAGFQAKADPKAKGTAGHVLEALALFYEPKLKEAYPPTWSQLLQDIVSWFGGDGEVAMQMLLAAISHHGRPVSMNDYLSSGVGRGAKHLWGERHGYNPMSALAILAETARTVFPDAFAVVTPVIAAPPALQQRFAGLVMLADWIASDTQFFPYRASPSEDRVALARAAAERALSAIGLHPSGQRSTRPFRDTFGFAPSPLQETLASALAVDDTSRLLLIESDTGSGKTEAALAWFFRLYAEGKVDGLYFGLPTRVAARELYERVRTAIDRAFEPAHRPGPVLLAAPGYVRIDGNPVLPDPTATLWDDSERDRRRERLWSAERPKRFLAAPIAVGTIDQALLSVLQVKHSLLRSVCLDRHLLVVDEVHASDPYMHQVLQALLQGHVARGGWALLLSATLGEVAAAAFFVREPLPLGQAIERPYPLISSRGGGCPLPAARRREIEVEVSPTLTDDQALIPQLVAALEKGARILVIANTVNRANNLLRQVESVLKERHPQLLRALFDLDGVRCPHHGRFAREDRERLDAQVTRLMGPRSVAAPLLLIGTQTLEQSLDIDADWLVTDLAPMDVLVQRLGRLHRHARDSRPLDFEKPRALVRVPDRDLAEYLSKQGILRGPAGLGNVYADGRVLVCTIRELRKRGVLRLPDDARALIELTTHPQAFSSLGKVWDNHGRNILARELSELRTALSSVLTNQPFGELHYLDKGETVATRLSEPTLDVPLTVPSRSAFGTMIERVPIPARWLTEARFPETVDPVVHACGFHFTVSQQTFSYSRFGLEREKRHA